MSLQEYLNAKPLYYEKIDYERMPRVYEKIKNSLHVPKIIHIIGTNGKGTTGRFLADALHLMGHKVGHYTSPHILKFNERIWLNGQNASDEALEQAHRRLQKLLDKSDADALSYFEYTTLLAVLLFEKCDYAVMEAGLGGEHDATAVFPKILTLVTPIAYDHEAFLGSSIADIAATKLRSIQKNAILARQRYDEVYEAASALCREKSLTIKRADELLDESDREKINLIAQNFSLAPYLKENLSLSVAALNFLGLAYKAEDFSSAPLFGRLTKIARNVIIDVGHNTLAASSIAEALKGERFVLVYNSYKDKNYQEILSLLKPIILHVEIIEVQNDRIASQDAIERTLDALGISHRVFEKTKEEQNYLVFGSFCVIEAFLGRFV